METGTSITLKKLRQAGVTAGYGDVLGGIGVQHYPGGSQNAGNIMRTLQNLSVQGCRSR